MNADANLTYYIEKLEEKYSIKFKKLGKNYFALCPMHNERTPSFSVYEKNDEVYYYCFGCQAKGFVKKLLGEEEQQEPTEEEKLKIHLKKTIDRMYRKYISFLLTTSTIFMELLSEIKEDELDNYIELLSETARINTLLNFFLDENIDYETKIQHFLRQKVPQTNTPKVDVFLITSQKPQCTIDLVIANIKKNKELLQDIACIKAIEEVIYAYL